jgi:hypothetical protein
MDLNKIKLIVAYCVYAIYCVALGKITYELILSLQTVSQERAGLFYLYEAIKMDSFIVEQIKNIDVSSWSSQYGIYQMEVFYGFDFECCKTLYQYHLYHKVKIGSTFILLENTYAFSKDELELQIPNKLWDLRTSSSPTGYKIETFVVCASIVAYAVYCLAIYLSSSS